MTKVFRNLLAPFLTALIGIAFASAVLAETRIASWNVKRFTSGNKDLAAMARVIAHFDFVALQEVMDDHAVMDLVMAVQESTGSEWGVMISHAIGRGSYKKHYTFLWRKSHVSYVDGAVVYLDSRDVFAQEPLSARFKTADGDTFVAANIHVLYGDDKADRAPEIEALASYWAWLGESFPGEQIFLMGDFNMEPDDRSYRLLKQMASPLITKGATTLSTRNGRFANLYDNVWVPNNLEADIEAGIFDLPGYLGMSNKETRKHVSDHAPVYMILNDMDEAAGDEA